MDKIIELVCEEARRRPGNDFLRNIYQVKMDIDVKVGEIMATVREAERIEALEQASQGDGLNDL